METECDTPALATERSARIAEHLPLVSHVVFQVAVHFPRHVDRDELAHAGALGLVEAAHRFDAARSVPFNRFAAQRIRGAVLDSVRSADWAPRSVRQVARAIDRAGQSLTTELGRPPSCAELAEAVQLSPAELVRLQGKIDRSTVLALDRHVGAPGDETVTLGATIGGTEPEVGAGLERRELHAYLRDAISHLPERHQAVVVGYFLRGRSSLELAVALGVTESRISQLRSEALVMLKQGISDQYDGAPLPVTPTDRPARRRAAFASAVGRSSTWRDRLQEVQPA